MAGDGGNTNPEATAARWTASPLYLAMCDALETCGLTEQAARARITNQDEWDEDGDPSWPSPDKATRDRFHAEWTARVQQRCGLDPLKTPDERRGDVLAAKPASDELVARNRAIADAYESGESMARVGVRFGLSERGVCNVLQKLGIKGRPSTGLPKGARISEVRATVLALVADGVPRLSIAMRLGITPQAVSYHTTTARRQEAA